MDGLVLGSDALAHPPTLVSGDDPPGMIAALHTLARYMAEMTQQAPKDGLAPPTIGNAKDLRQAGQSASAIHTNRGKRANFFPPALFGEPAWDILLDLFVAAKGKELRSVKAVCLASQVPEATALRHIAQLSIAGLIEQKRDPADRRRKFLFLTASGEQKMEAYLLELLPIGDQAQELIRFLSTNV